MRISILTPDVSQNCFGRAYLLARILQKHYEVEIVGPAFGRGIWPPLANDTSISCKYVRISGRIEAYWELSRLLGLAEGEVVYASKPLITSFGIGLLKKMIQEKPLLLDIDDWQAGLVMDMRSRLSLPRRLKLLTDSALFPFEVSSYWNNLLCEKLAGLADGITVSNRFLQHKFGGELVWHARDTGAFSPDRYDSQSVRRDFGIAEDKKVVMFFGTPRPHKGIEDLIAAVRSIGNRSTILMVVGIDYESSYCRTLLRKAMNDLSHTNFLHYGLQSFDKIPELLAMADVAAIPQRSGPAAKGQLPAKVFDAMAMARPIVATRVSDHAEILAECGWLVEPEQPVQLADAIQYVFDHPQEAARRGSLARAKCMKEYSYESMSRVLREVFKKYE